MNKIIILFFTVAVMTASSGCQKIKKIFIKPPEEGIIQESYPVRVYAYDSSVVIKAAPGEVIDSMVKDFSWLERASESISGLQMEVQDLKPGLDMSEVGQSVGFNIKILFINLPCRLVTLKYKENRELWLMAIAEGSWVLFRVDIKPVPEGSIFNISVIISLSPALQRVVDFSQISEAAASRIDLLVAFVQAEFDPELDVNKVTEKGLRGQSYEKFLQAHEASTWINASPENAIKRALEPDNFREILSTDSFEGLAECLFEPENRRRWEQGGGDPIYCPDTTVRIAGFDWRPDYVVIVKPEEPKDFFTLYAVVINTIAQVKIFTEPESGGARTRLVVEVEPPGSANPNLLEALLSISRLPQLMEKILVNIKTRVEGIG